MKNALVATAGLLAWLCLADALAFSPIPRESAKALGATKSRKPIDDGLVFVNGRFIPPPYVVERWGTGIRVNGVQATGQVVDWADFVRTQDGATARPPAPSAPPAAEPPKPAPEPEPEEFEDVSCSLDFLFDDAPAARQKASAKPKPRPKRKPAPKPAAPPEPVPALAGEFVRNDAAKALLARVNAARTEIDRVLRGGGFICFGDGYSRLTGDRKLAERLMDGLPEAQQRSESAGELKEAVRAAGLFYLHDAVCDDLFRNRIGYRALQERRAKVRRDRELNALLGQDEGGVR